MMSLFGPHFDPNQCKVQLKLAVSRIQILKNKKANLVRDEKRHIAELLRNKNEDAARIRVETVIRDEALIECYSIIEVLCELLFARLPLIACSCDIPDEIKESIYTLIYAAQRVQIPELELIKKQLLAKYGKTLENEVNCHCQTYVNPKIVHKLSYVTPEPFLVFQHLNDIACQFKVDWSVEPILPPTMAITPQPPMFMAAAPTAGHVMVPPMAPLSQPQPSMKSPPPFPNMVAPQHYTPNFPSPPPQIIHHQSAPPPAYTPSPMPPTSSAPPPFPQFPTAPSFHSPPSNPQQPMNFPQPPKQSSQPPPPPYSPYETPSNHNDAAGFPDFDELTARFEALKRQNNN